MIFFSFFFACTCHSEPPHCTRACCLGWVLVLWEGEKVAAGWEMGREGGKLARKPIVAPPCCAQMRHSVCPKRTQLHRYTPLTEAKCLPAQGATQGASYPGSWVTEVGVRYWHGLLLRGAYIEVDVNAYGKPGLLTYPGKMP